MGRSLCLEVDILVALSEFKSLNKYHFLDTNRVESCNGFLLVLGE